MCEFYKNVKDSIQKMKEISKLINCMLDNTNFLCTIMQNFIIYSGIKLSNETIEKRTQ